MTLLAFLSAALLAPMLGVALGNLFTAQRLEHAGTPRRRPRVSLLVPARNEAETLGTTLPALLRLDYPELEILVLDDSSEDGTAAVVRAHGKGAHGRLRLLQGRPLPPGWLGKNWACHQLAEAATGELLIFCDADVMVAPRALLHTCAAMERGGATVLTALPRQRFGSWQERAVVPLVAHLPVVALLPLALVVRTAAPTLSMANGQWLVFSREAYRASGGHAAVRAEIVEDVALGRRAKAAGERLLPVVAGSLLEVRMYGSAAALHAGFGKNLYALAGGRPIPFALALCGFVLTAIVPWLAPFLGVPGGATALLLLLAVRGCGAILLRQGVGSLLLHPPGSVLLVWIALRSWAGTRSGTLRWKGRPLHPGTGVEPHLTADALARTGPR